MSDTLRAMGLMTLAMAAFTLADSAIKAMSDDLSAGLMVFTLGLGSAVIFGGVLRWNGLPQITPDILNPAVLIRGFCDMAGTIAVVIALALIPLANLTAIMQSTPLIVSLGAMVILCEPIGWRRWLAILVGFGGVLIILQPGADTFSFEALAALAAALGLAGRDLASRAIPARISTLHATTWGTWALVLGGAVFAIIQGLPDSLPGLWSWVLLVGTIASGAFAIYCVTAAMRLGDVGSVSPMRYTRLIFGIGAAMLFFGERPAAHVWIGAALIAASGLFVLWRERRLAKG